MPQERTSQFPFPTAEEAVASPGGREIKAARNVVSRRIDGIPKRGYITGDCDSAPVIKGVADLTTAAYNLVDLIDAANLNCKRERTPTFEEWNQIIDSNAALVALMEDHRCHPATAEGEDA